MKTRLLFLALAIICSKLVAQDYYDINFSGVNAEPQTVLVKNLTRGLTLEVQGNQTLRLRIVEYFEDKLVIYPNPSYHSCNIEFAMVRSGIATFQLYDFGGSLIGQFGFHLYQEGGYTFLLSGLPRGSYLLRVQTPTAVMTGKVIVFEQIDPAPKKVTLNEVDFRPNQISSSEKSGMSIAEMKFWPGDKLMYIGRSSGFPEAFIYSAPVESKSHTFVFAQNWPNGYYHCNEKDTEIVDVTNPLTGRTWMDRNLGASQVATSSTDELAYGDIFQWGRFADGHQCRNAPITYQLSESDQPAHGSVIGNMISNSNGDWRETPNDDLWQGVDGINNPCPLGYRLPTEAEFFFENKYWYSNDRAGAFNSPLKLPCSGTNWGNSDPRGQYWTSTIGSYSSTYFNTDHYSRIFDFYNFGVRGESHRRSRRFTVRCIKEETIAPSVITSGFTQTNPNDIFINGIVAKDGGAEVTSRGFVWNRTGNPTLADNEGMVTQGQGLGEFASAIPDFSEGIYYFRAFATNAIGTRYGSVLARVFQDDNYRPGSVHCGQPSEVVGVTNPVTGRVWMDRNLGASRVATSPTDKEAYGDLYQWGRAADGHQCRLSETTTTPSSSPNAGHGHFVLGSNWTSPLSPNLWEGVNSVNNPCPAGYRVPTEAELLAEVQSWSSQNSEGAFNSPLKLPVAGLRRHSDGKFAHIGVYGNYWSSALNRLFFHSSATGWTGGGSARGASVRCIATPFLPTVTTITPTSITNNTAISGGLVSYDGEGFIIARGVVWSQAPNPTLGENEGFTTDGTGDGIFTSNLSGLADGIYYVRAYATNSVGTTYGNEFSFVTQDDNYQSGTVNCGDPTEIADVINPLTGRTWMDRNLGASRVATSPTDQESFGDLYQWGRFADGHQCRDSERTTILSDTDRPNHGMFIIASSSPWDWRSPQNDDLWQGPNGINNPCPKGYRPPTEAELNDERLSWPNGNYSLDFGSPLKIPQTRIWSSTVSDTRSRSFGFSGSSTNFNNNFRAIGYGLRCIATPFIPVLNTVAPQLITGGNAISGGNVVNDGETSILARGVVWSQNSNPNIQDNIGITNDGTGDGIFTSHLSGLTDGIYYVRAYATNIAGTAYGNEFSFVTTDDNYQSGTVNCGDPTEIVNVLNPVTGKIWMDRNLGASRAATDSRDQEAYGDLFQWGRFADGHQCRNSATTSTQSISDTPGHGMFITGSSDWRTTPNHSLWQGYDGTNNPCPKGYRPPTQAEFNEERLSWIQNNHQGAFDSPLKLTRTGTRSSSSLSQVGNDGRYWTSSPNNDQSWAFSFSSSSSSFLNASRNIGNALRCIAAPTLPVLNTIAPHLNEDGTAISGGNIIDDNQTPILERGVVWSHNPNPSIGNYIGITNDGTGTGIYSSLLTGLEGDAYYVRAFAKNEMGTSYGRQFYLVIDNQHYPAGSVHCGAATEVVEVINPGTGKVWMDRNLGASRAATATNDAQAYGDLYQWGRFADGHQCRISPTTSTLSNSDLPGHGIFILGMGYHHDWLSPQNTNLWQDASGFNNPCPSGYRLPTEAELDSERLSWSSNDATGAFAAPLKLPVAGRRDSTTGLLDYVGSWGNYWTSTVSGTVSRYLFFLNGNAYMTASYRSSGFSVRCIMAGPPPMQPSDIIGPDNPCKNQLDLNYGVNPEPDVVYIWTVPNGWTITDGQGTPQIVVNSGSNSGIIEVVPKNDNGFGLSQSLNVTISQMTKPNPPTATNHNATTNQIIWNWNQVMGADGYRWHTVNDFASAIDLGSATSYVEGDLSCSPCGINYTRYVWAYSNHCGRSHELVLSQSTVSCPTEIIDVVNPATGATWMDRNLGASQVANSSNDSLSFGDLYQWGRLSDGHQCRNSSITTTVSSTDQPGHGFFISTQFDWRNPQNSNLWQGIDGVNNPCPVGYRLPTLVELESEYLSWDSNNTAGAFASPLKLPVAGKRGSIAGLLNYVGSWGYYWSSTVSDTNSHVLYFNSSYATTGFPPRGYGHSVRCIKDE